MIVIVGQNPSTAKQKKNSTFDRLGKWTKAVGLESYDFMNCSDDPGDKYEIDYERLSATKTTMDKYSQIRMFTIRKLWTCRKVFILWHCLL